MTTLATAVPTQEALSDYLQHGGYDRHLRQLRQTLADSQARALRGIAKCFPKGTRVTRPEGGYFLWVELPEQVDALKLHRLALSQNISLAPGHLFSADKRFANCLRLNYGQAGDERFDDAIRTIGQLASAQLTA
jgi:DNA-binding transcriptional MocR family regulator